MFLNVNFLPEVANVSECSRDRFIKIILTFDIRYKI